MNVFCCSRYPFVGQSEIFVLVYRLCIIVYALRSLSNWPFVITVQADWFSPNTVHRLERQVVPHFFSGKSAEHTPEKYMECRNCIVAKYMESPVKHLSVDDCHGIVAGISTDDVTRIARFLDHWGIINYCSVPSKDEAPKDGTYLYEDSNGDLCVPVAGLKSIDSLVQFDKPKCRLKAKDIYPELAHECDDDSNFDNSIRELLSENRCNCCSQPVSLAYYQSQKEVYLTSTVVFICWL